MVKDVLIFGGRTHCKLSEIAIFWFAIGVAFVVVRAMQELRHVCGKNCVCYLLSSYTTIYALV